MNAFPELHSSIDENGGRTFYESAGGMDLRDYFAAKAMQAILADNDMLSAEKVADAAYWQADAMMKARQS